jgi:hypothetical protein
MIRVALVHSRLPATQGAFCFSAQAIRDNLRPSSRQSMWGYGGLTLYRLGAARSKTSGRKPSVQESGTDVGL